MKIRHTITFVLFMASVPLFAQQNDTTKMHQDTTKMQQAPPPAAQPPAAQPAATQPAAAQPAAAQTQEAPAPDAQDQEGSGKKMYYGGTIGASFGDYSYFSVSPEIGWVLNPKMSVGLIGTYQYYKDKAYNQDITGSNYGGGVFSRYRFHPLAYFHAEFDYMSYEYATSLNTKVRDWVPFLLLGGGITKPMGGNASAYVECLFDVLQDSKSPYSNWTPFVSVGVTVGF